MADDAKRYECNREYVGYLLCRCSADMGTRS